MPCTPLGRFHSLRLRTELKADWNGERLSSQYYKYLTIVQRFSSPYSVVTLLYTDAVLRHHESLEEPNHDLRPIRSRVTCYSP